MLKKIVSWSLIMCLTIITLLLPGRTVNFAWQSVYAAEQSENDPAMISSGILGYSYRVYNSGDIVAFTTAETDYEYKSILVDLSADMTSVYANDFIQAVNSAEAVYEDMQNAVIKSQTVGIIGLWLASGPLTPAAFIPMIIALELKNEADELAPVMDEYLNDIRRAYRFLYRHRIIDNNGCVIVDNQQICSIKD